MRGFYGFASSILHKELNAIMRKEHFAHRFFQVARAFLPWHFDKAKSLAKEAYPGFPYPIYRLTAYAFSSKYGIFVLSLKEGSLISFFPENIDAFKSWLDHNGIKDVSNETRAINP